MTTTTADTRTATVHANGIDIHYVEAGSRGQADLVILHGGLVSTNPLWDATPFSYGGYFAELSRTWHVVAPDLRGYGLTRHVGTERVSMSLLADDVAAFIETLGLDHPTVVGFSLGGSVATIMAIRHPGLIRALVNDAGCDVFDPESPSFQMLPVMFGGSADAEQADPEAVERTFGADPEMSMFLSLIKADHDSAGGPGYWQTMLRHFFESAQRWPGYGFADLAAIDVPVLILGGDRDDLSRVEDSVQAYRHLRDGQLCIVSNTAHMITAAKVSAIMEFAA